MSSNEELIRKADIALGDLASGGLLSPEQGATFIRRLIKSPTMLRLCRVVEMTSPQRKINKIGFGNRILRKATSAVPLPAVGQSGTVLGGRAKPTTTQITLNTKEQIAEVRLPYDVLEDNIERATAANNEAANTGPGGLRQTLIDLIAERAALDLEELSLLADTSYNNGADLDDTEFLSQADGWLKIAAVSGHIADQTNTTINKATFKSGLKAMPVQYMRNRAALTHFVSANNITEYRDTLADRVGTLGDANVVGLSPAYAYGSMIEQVALMPESKGLFSDPLNFIFGIQRQVSMEFDKDITSRVYIIVVTCRIDFKIEEPDGVIEYTNIAS
jgi:hypothetical protein